MTTLSSELGTPATPVARGRSLPHLWSVLIWLVATLIAVFFAVILRDSTVVDGSYLPRGNDSFYHARRILDAAGGIRGFYQFDNHIQAPEGSWISWPWAYDYLMAKVAQVALWIAPTVDPLAILVYVPVAWIFVNAALFMAVAGAIGLSLEMRGIAMLCFALSPLTQLLHGIGMLDHHYVEHTFVLLTVWLGLRWFKTPDDRVRATTLGIALGLAPAFHNGLFILQIVPLTAVFALWVRRAGPARPAVYAFGIALIVATEVVLLPSEPYRNGMFEFGLLSWFHFYVAVCTAAVLTFMTFRPFSASNLGMLAAIGVVLVMPLGTQIVSGANFLSGEFSILGDIVEAQSPYKLFTATFGPTETASYYSWLLLLAPALLAYYAYRIYREREPARVYYAVVVALGLALLLDQFRLSQFGFFGLVTGGLLVIDELRVHRRWHRGTTFAATLATIVLAYQPALRDRLFVVYAPGGDAEYASALPIFRDLHRLCAADTGVVLANPDDGSAIVFHSDCRVIANNFILRRSDKEHIDEVSRLFRLSPAEIRAARPDVEYLFVRRTDFSRRDGNVTRLADSPIARQLFVEATPPEGYTLVETIKTRADAEGAEGIYARLYKVAPAATSSSQGPREARAQ